MSTMVMAIAVWVMMGSSGAHPDTKQRLVQLWKWLDEEAPLELFRSDHAYTAGLYTNQWIAPVMAQVRSVEEFLETMERDKGLANTAIAGLHSDTNKMNNCGDADDIALGCDFKDHPEAVPAPILYDENASTIRISSSSVSATITCLDNCSRPGPAVEPDRNQSENDSDTVQQPPNDAAILYWLQTLKCQCCEKRTGATLAVQKRHLQSRFHLIETNIAIRRRYVQHASIECPLCMTPIGNKNHYRSCSKGKILPGHYAKVVEQTAELLLQHLPDAPAISTQRIVDMMMPSRPPKNFCFCMVDNDDGLTYKPCMHEELAIVNWIYEMDVPCCRKTSALQKVRHIKTRTHLVHMYIFLQELHEADDVSTCPLCSTPFLHGFWESGHLCRRNVLLEHHVKMIKATATLFFRVFPDAPFRLESLIYTLSSFHTYSVLIDGSNISGTSGVSKHVLCRNEDIHDRVKLPRRKRSITTDRV